MTNLKFNTFIDTYTLPYVSTHRYWTGLMLLLRFVLSLIPALNYSGNLKIVLAFITFTIGLVLFLKSLVGRVYTKQGIDILETLFLLNLLFFTVFTWFALDATHIQIIISHVFCCHFLHSPSDSTAIPCVRVYKDFLKDTQLQISFDIHSTV